MSRVASIRPLVRACLCAAVLAHLPSVRAATFKVDTTSDDGSAPLQVCSDATPNDCSLRGAIAKSNASAGSDTVGFDIPATDAGYVIATGHWRIAPATNLPFISDDLVIDGYTQPGAQANTLAPDEGGSNAVPKIELHGFGGNGSDGLDVGNGNPHLTLRGLAINNFTINLALYSPGPHRVEGCFIGTDIGGMHALAASGNSLGIRQRGQATIGGTTPAARNLISGNGYIGVWDESGTTTVQPSTFQGNIVGLAADGVTVLPGQDYGLFLNGAAEGAQLGGNTVAARNLFAGNEINAIYLSGNNPAVGAPPIRIQGNFFGTDWSGTLARPNGTLPSSPTQPQPTIHVSRAGRCGVAIGGDAPGEGNLIANGAAAGVHIGACTGAAIRGNRFRGNRIGIDLSPSTTTLPDGATPNDAGDIDDGSNRMQNFPVIDSVVYSNGGGTITLTYRVDTTPANAAYPLRVDIAYGGNQAEGVVLSDIYTAAEAQQPRSVDFSASALMGLPLVLHATDADGNSSEFNGDGIFADDFED